MEEGSDCDNSSLADSMIADHWRKAEPMPKSTHMKPPERRQLALSNGMRCPGGGRIISVWTTPMPLPMVPPMTAPMKPCLAFSFTITDMGFLAG